MNTRSSFRTHFIAAAFSLAAIGLTNAATVTVYTDRPTWETAVANAGYLVVEEDFNDNLVNAPGLSVITSVGQATNMEWQDQMDTSPLQTTTWSFAAPFTFAWGATFDMTPNNAGSGIDLFVDLLIGPDETIDEFVPGEFQFANNPPGSVGFYGIVSDMAFSSVTTSTGSFGFPNIETYDLDDLVFSTVIPEPSRALLVLFGIMSVGFKRRRLA